MIVEFRVANYRSINEEQVLSFEAARDDHLSGVLLRDPERLDMPLLPSLYLYGGNASGKSNICRALFTLRFLACYSATRLNRGDAIPEIDAFRLNMGSLSLPSTFGFMALIDGELWDYQVSADVNNIHFESLRRKANTQKARWSDIFVRHGTNTSDWIANAPRLNKTFFESVRENATILSKAASDNIEIVKPIYDQIGSMTFRRMADPPRDVVKKAIDSSEEDPMLWDWLAKIVSCADILVNEIKIDSKSLIFDDLPENVKYLLARDADMAPDSKILEQSLRFLINREDGSIATFDMGDLSDGTIRFIALILEVFQSLMVGSVLILDEFDASLHPLLGSAVRDILSDSDLNPKRAQFIAASHNDTLLNSSKLRSDQVIMVSRTASWATQWYALSELDRRPRTGESYRGRYLAGGYGGVPRIGDLRAAILEKMDSLDES